MSTHPKTKKEETPIVDQYRDKFIDLRASFLNHLEIKLRDQDIDPIEALQILCATLLFDETKAVAYLRSLSEAPSLWNLPSKVSPRSAKSKVELIAGFGSGQ